MPKLGEILAYKVRRYTQVLNAAHKALPYARVLSSQTSEEEMAGLLNEAGLGRGGPARHIIKDPGQGSAVSSILPELRQAQVSIFRCQNEKHAVLENKSLCAQLLHGV